MAITKMIYSTSPFFFLLTWRLKSIAGWCSGGGGFSSVALCCTFTSRLRESNTIRKIRDRLVLMKISTTSIQEKSWWLIGRLGKEWDYRCLLLEVKREAQILKVYQNTSFYGAHFLYYELYGILGLTQFLLCINLAWAITFRILSHGIYT